MSCELSFSEKFFCNQDPYELEVGKKPTCLLEAIVKLEKGEFGKYKKACLEAGGRNGKVFLPPNRNNSYGQLNMVTISRKSIKTIVKLALKQKIIRSPLAFRDRHFSDLTIDGNLTEKEALKFANLLMEEDENCIKARTIKDWISRNLEPKATLAAASRYCCRKHETGSFALREELETTPDFTF